MNGRTITKIDQSALPPPDRSWLRKMSLKIAMISQNQMMNRKNHNMERKTSPVPKLEATTMASVSLVSRCHRHGCSPRVVHSGVCGIAPHLTSPLVGDASGHSFGLC